MPTRIIFDFVDLISDKRMIVLLKLRVSNRTTFAKHFLEIMIIQVSEFMFKTMILCICICLQKWVLIDKITFIIRIIEPSQFLCQWLHTETHGDNWIFLIMVYSVIWDIKGWSCSDNFDLPPIDFMVFTKERPKLFRDLLQIFTVISAH